MKNKSYTKSGPGRMPHNKQRGKQRLAPAHGSIPFDTYMEWDTCVSIALRINSKRAAA